MCPALSIIFKISRGSIRSPILCEVMFLGRPAVQACSLNTLSFKDTIHGWSPKNLFASNYLKSSAEKTGKRTGSFWRLLQARELEPRVSL